MVRFSLSAVLISCSDTIHVRQSALTTARMTTPEPGSTDAKKKRYDRQLRLWGEHGQTAMEESSICLLNASATGAETLKNLVLPGAPHVIC